MNLGLNRSADLAPIIVVPSMVKLGSTAMMSPRCLPVMRAATPEKFGPAVCIDESLRAFDPDMVKPGQVVGISVYTPNAYCAYRIGREVRRRGGAVIYGGPHASIFPDEALDPRYGSANAVVQGDADRIWGTVLEDHALGRLQPKYRDGNGRIPPECMVEADWGFMDPGPFPYLIGSIQTIRGCPKNCSFCSVWIQDGRAPRQRSIDSIMREVKELFLRGVRAVMFSDDNFYPYTLASIQGAERKNSALAAEMRKARNERFRLMARLEFFRNLGMRFATQITMEAADDPDVLPAMKRAGIVAVLVGVEATTREALLEVSKLFNSVGPELEARLRKFQENHIGVLASVIFGLHSDTPETFDDTLSVLGRANAAFAQFIPIGVFPGTVDFKRLEKSLKEQYGEIPNVSGTEVPISRAWVLPPGQGPRMGTHNHPKMPEDYIRERVQGTWKKFYRFSNALRRARKFKLSLRHTMLFVALSKVFCMIYSKSQTGVAADSVRSNAVPLWVGPILRLSRVFFLGKPTPDLQVPGLPASYKDPVYEPVNSGDTTTGDLVRIA